MLKWIKSWVTPSPRKETLASILDSRENRDSLLGVLEQIAPSRDQIERDSVRIINYSNSKDYSIFAKEAWSEVLKSMDKLTSDSLSDRQVDFYRGKLSATLDLLRMSFFARQAKTKLEQEKKLEQFK